SQHTDRVEILMFNWERFDANLKVTSEIASFRIIREGGNKVGLEFVQHLVDRDGGLDRLEGAMAHILVPKEAA
ncbi:MAG: hypothetical protein WCI73_06665, partial [Phycisphaerae bacterium]